MYNGDAQGDPEIIECVFLIRILKRDNNNHAGTCVATFDKRLDCTQKARQIKRGILRTDAYELPHGLASSPDDCILVLNVDGNQIEIDNDEPLTSISQDTSVHIPPMVLEILEPGVRITLPPVAEGELNIKMVR